MISIARKIWLYALLTVMTLSATGCIYEDGEDSEPVDDGMVTLVLDLSSNTGIKGLAPATKAPTRADTWDYEQPVTDREKVKELRIIIVRPGSNNLVEHNIYATYDAVWETLDTKEIPVKGNEMKNIYLIANESGLSEEIRGKLTSITEDMPLSVDLQSLTIATDTGQPYISSIQAGTTYVPMTETFDFYVPDARNITEDLDGKKRFAVEMFVTRATTKFSFTARKAEGAVISKGIRVKSITFSGAQPGTGFSTVEYLFPRKAIYAPDKYSPSAEKFGGREITSFLMPQGATSYSYTFEPAAFGLNGTATDGTALTDVSDKYVPAEYFLESGLQNFTLSITTECNGIETVWEPAAFDNLPRLPRNTHVLVQLTLTDANLQVIVKLVPWIGVNLDYTFGFDDLIPWDRKPNGEVSPVP